MKGTFKMYLCVTYLVFIIYKQNLHKTQIYNIQKQVNVYTHIIHYKSRDILE